MKTKVQVLGGSDILPHDKDTERIVLGTLIQYNEEYGKYSDMLCVDMFYETENRRAYQCIAGVIGQGEIANVQSLCAYADKNDIQLVDDNGTFDERKQQANKQVFLDLFMVSNRRTLEQDIERLRYLGKQRRMWLMLQQAAKNAIDPTMEIDEVANSCATALEELRSDTFNEEIKTFEEATDALRREVSENAHGNRTSLTTGFRLFDNHYLLRSKTVTVIAAFTSVGKSSLAMNIAVNVAKTGAGVAYYSLEMGATELVSRVISSDMELPSSVILNGQLNEWQLNKFDEVIGKRKTLPIYIDERSTLSFDRTIRSIRTMVKKKGIKLAIIDYLQIYSQGAENQEQFLAYMARTAKNEAMELGIAIILISQLNRGGLHPAINMMRGSGQIEESADHIVLIDRPEAYPDNKVKKYEGKFSDKSITNTAKLILSKGRGVGTGCSLVAFESKYTRFSDMPEQEEEPYVEQESKTETEDTGNYPFRAQEEELPF